jgi:hypothetical protein
MDGYVSAASADIGIKNFLIANSGGLLIFPVL